jgi:DNA-binding winged helix-turn-helix (wHTH) protein
VLLHLAHKRNRFVSHEELFEAVWHGFRSDAALRSTMKLLRKKLRDVGLTQLANAIDGSSYGHYILKLAQ